MSEQFCFHSSIDSFVEKHFSEVSAPFSAGIELSAKCNLKCVHCYAKTGIQDDDLTTEDVKHILDILCEKGTLAVYFTGGEVFLRPDFEELFRYARLKGMSVSVLSNITLLTEDHIRVMKEYPVDTVSTSLYGITPETYELVTGVPGSFEKFNRALDLLIENGIRTNLKFIVLKENIHEVFRAREFADERGLDLMTAYGIVPAGNGDLFPLEHRVRPEQAFEYDWKDEKRKDFWMKKAEEVRLERQGLKPKHTYRRKEEDYLYPCDIAWHSVFIDHRGHMMGCIKAGFCSYNLLDGEFDQGWKYLQENLRNVKANGRLKCNTCDSFHYCEQCSAIFCDENERIEIDPFYCRLADQRKKFVEKMAEQLESNPPAGAESCLSELDIQQEESRWNS